MKLRLRGGPIAVVRGARMMYINRIYTHTYIQARAEAGPSDSGVEWEALVAQRLGGNQHASRYGDQTTSRD
jgi:hypothetical protein